MNRRFREITEESLELEPLGSELLAYFAGRMITRKTLSRNSVMQKRRGNQETNTEKILYGLDDINGASDNIIVEGEMDKLAMEEAGFKNCVSVPDGSPRKDPPGQALAEELARRLRRGVYLAISTSISTITQQNLSSIG
ncbi:Twinkle-like protein [Forsythia ovata]|uniref:Twinkle-like protein n=1 Tax=Forsythia ovata TaxID=205694 RepID=A0ABD1QCG2_9LAMI